MIKRLLQLSLHHRALVLCAAAALLIAGFMRATHMPIDVFPDLTAPRVTVVTESTGMAAEEVEQLITFPIETAVAGTAGLRRVRSASAPGISIVWAEFDWRTQDSLARQRIAERLQNLSGNLPPQASAPLLAPASSVMGEIAFVALTSEHTDLMTLRRIADVDVRRRLLAVDGVAQVTAIGGEVKQYQILIDPDRVERLGLTLEAVTEAVRRGSQNAPGGYLVDRGQEAVVRVLGRARHLDDLSAIVITHRDTVPIRVADVAQVKVGPAVPRGAAGYKGQRAVLLSITKQPQADTVSTTSRLDTVLDELDGMLKARDVQLRRDIFRQQDFIDMAVDNLLVVLRDGVLLVILVLFLFLWSFRPTIISLLALPLSLMTAVLALDLLDMSIDTMTLGGLAIAIGVLVDDAIVDVENVMRRLRERLQQPEADRPTVIATVLSASMEIRPTIVSATLILMLVFMPLLMLGGIEGRLLQPLAISYLVAIFASLIVAVTVTPVLCSLLLPTAIQQRPDREPPLIHWIVDRYAPILQTALRRQNAVLLFTLLITVAGISSLWQAGRSFLPEFNEGSLTINMVLLPGTSLVESDSLASIAEKILMADPGVLTVGRRTGRAERDEHVLGVETSELEVRIRPDDKRGREQLFADIRERLRGVPGATFSLGQPISHRIEHMLSGQRSALSIKVVGEDLRVLRRLAENVANIAKRIDGLVDVNVEQIVEIPQLVIRVDPQAAANYGFSAGEAARAVSLALWGDVAGHIYEDGTITDVVVKYPQDVLSSQTALKGLRIPTPAGALVPVEALADLRQDTGPNYILRENVRRRVAVSANIMGGDVVQTHALLREQLQKQMKLPSDVHLEFAGQFERERETSQRLLAFGLLSILGIAFVVATTLGSALRAAIVLLNLPLALAGGVIGVYAAGGLLSIATTIGFITLFGIATRNGLLLATRTQDLYEEGVSWTDAVTRGAHERLAPILMTALTAALGLLPLGLALGQPGSEIQAPMALVILTGLITSTLLNMIIIPTALIRFATPKS